MKTIKSGKSKSHIVSIDYDALFEIWADFDDEKSCKSVKRLIEERGLGQMDAFSFSGFCYGYYKALQKARLVK